MTNKEVINRGQMEAAAREKVGFLIETRKLILEQHASMYKWLTASLLAINGGASVALLGAQAVDVNWRVIAVGLFTLGILLALLVGVAAQKIGLQGLPTIQNSIEYWAEVIAGASRDEEAEADLTAKMKKIDRRALIVPLIGWFSALMFVIGLSVAAWGMLYSGGGTMNGKSAFICSDSRFS